jgi:hypothetical protein
MVITTASLVETWIDQTEGRTCITVRSRNDGKALRVCDW